MLGNLDRQTLLKLVAGAIVGLYLLDLIVIEPAIHRWSEQTERIDALRKQVDKGHDLLKREDRIRALWASMQRANLPTDQGAAETAAFSAISRWTRDSGIALTSIVPQWQSHEDDGYDSYECRAAATGNQVALGRFLYELGTDPLPCNLEECEISTRDTHGQQLTMSARFSFVRVSPDIGGSGSNSSARRSE